MSVIAGLVDRTTPGRPLDRVRAMLEVFRRQSSGGLQTADRGRCAIGIGQLTTSPTPRRVGGLHDKGNVCAVVDGRLDRVGDFGSSLGLDAAASDAEIVVAAYEQLGTDCFSRLRGDFAIGLWDQRSDLLVAARDSFAVRPLYYAVGKGWLAFASDPEQILAAGLAASEPDDDMVIDYLLWDARLVDRTFFRDIKALPAGHLLVADRRGYSVSGFRSIALEKVRLSSEGEYWDEYRRRFRNAVRAGLESRTPVVAELSGGLDSSSIVCVADQLLSEGPPLCPSIVAAAGLYPGLACDEEPFIRAVSRQVQIPVECWDATRGVPGDDLLDSSVALPGGRFATFSGTDGQVEIARAHGAHVLVSGVGGDQVGTAAGALRDAVTERRWKEAIDMVLHRPGANVKTVVDTAWALARSFVPLPLRRLRGLMRTSAERRPKWLSGLAKEHPRPRPAPDPPPGIESEIQRRMWRALTSGRHALVMAYAQHHALRNGLDVRFPFLDVDLVSIALSIPSRLWPPSWPFERLHRQILGDLLPREVVQRRGKAKFSPAVELRVRRQLPAIRDLFASSQWKSDRFVEQGAARQLLASFERDQTPEFITTYGVWAISTLEAWLRSVSRYATGLKVETYDI